MSKKFTALFIALIYLCSLNAFAKVIDNVVYDETEQTVTVSGTMEENDGKMVSLFLLNEGKEWEDRLEAKDPSDIFSHVGITTTDLNGNYKYTFSIADSIENYSSIKVLGNQNSASYEFSKEKNIYVSLSGSASGDGSEENPVSTLDAAKELASGNMGKTNILIHAGEYKLSDTVEFDSSDSANVNGEIVYKAYGDGEVIFSGSKDIKLSEFQKVTDKGLIARLPNNAKDKSLVIDLSKYGFTKEELTLSNDNDEKVSENKLLLHTKPLGVYFNSKQQTMACWPNSGFNYTKDINKDTENSEVSFAFDDTEPYLWNDIENAYLAGYLQHEYRGHYTKIDRIDTENKRIYSKATDINTNKENRYKVYNVLEEMDMAGEYYIDYNTLKMYYYPPQNYKATDTISISVSNTPLISLDGTKNITFENITFRDSYSDGIYSKNAENIKILGCKVYNIAKKGIRLHGKNITVENCDVYNSGMSGIDVSSDVSYNTLEKSGIVVRNNHIAQMNEDCFAQASPIKVKGVGAVVEQNTVHNSIYSAIMYNGIENNIKKNEVYNLGTQSGDTGAIYTYFGTTDYGSVVEENYIHSLKTRCDKIDIGIAGIYWDGYTSGQTAKNNIVVNDADPVAGTFGLFINGGRDNTAYNNIFVTKGAGVHLANPAENYKDTDEFRQAIKNSGLFNSDNSVISKDLGIVKKYTQLEKTIDMLTNEDKYYPDYDKVYDNLFIGSNPTVSKYSIYDQTGNNNLFDNNTMEIQSQFTSKYLYKNTSGDFLMNENYDLSQIGIQRDITIGSFSKTMPYNNEVLASSNTVTLAWEQAPFADDYTYTVATDENFSNIFAKGTTGWRSVEITGLNPNTKYYWKVSANNNSVIKAVESVACSDGVGTFVTSDKNFVVYGAKLSADNKTINFVYDNNGYDSASCYIAEYENEIFKAINLSDVSFSRGNEKVLTVKLENEVVYDDIIMFLWNENLKPVSDKKIFVSK